MNNKNNLGHYFSLKYYFFYFLNGKSRMIIFFIYFTIDDCKILKQKLTYTPYQWQFSVDLPSITNKVVLSGGFDHIGLFILKQKIKQKKSH